MKSFRLCILLLLACLLPLRGAVAATMACQGPGGAAVAAAASAHAHPSLHSAHAQRTDHAQHAAHASHADHTNHPDPAGHPDPALNADPGAADDVPAVDVHASTCHLCATGCQAVPLAPAPPGIAGPLLSATLTFPALRAPAPAFQSDGQERPPRTV